MSKAYQALLSATNFVLKKDKTWKMMVEAMLIFKKT